MNVRNSFRVEQRGELHVKAASFRRFPYTHSLIRFRDLVAMIPDLRGIAAVRIAHRS
jgi:hypothetical protein